MAPEWDLVVIGGGPAGMSAAQYAAEAGLKTLVLEEMAPGGAVLLINCMENFPGFPGGVNGYDFGEAMRLQTEKAGAEFRSAAAASVTKEQQVFTVGTTDGPVTSSAVVLSTGSRHRTLGVPGEAEFAGRGVSYCAACDGPFFRNKKILVVGGGDAACDEASYLAGLSCRVVMIHRRGRLRARKGPAAKVLNNPSIEVRFNHILEKIEGDSRVERVVLGRTDTGETFREDFDAVFVFTGSDPRTELVPDLPKDPGGFVITDHNMETPVKGLFAVGYVRATPFRQVVAACGEGAVAAHTAAAYIDGIRGEACQGVFQA